MLDIVKKYDNKLFARRKINGIVEIVRGSQFSSSKEYIVLEIKNQFIGSGRSIIEKIKSMDSRRIDFFADISKKMIETRNKKSDVRVHRDVASYINEGNKIII